MAASKDRSLSSHLLFPPSSFIPLCGQIIIWVGGDSGQFEYVGYTRNHSINRSIAGLLCRVYNERNKFSSLHTCDVKSRSNRSLLNFSIKPEFIYISELWEEERAYFIYNVCARCEPSSARTAMTKASKAVGTGSSNRQ